MWMRYAAFATPALLATVLAGALVPGTGARSQPAAAQETPTPPCENGTVGSSPADNPGLVRDCALLLAPPGEPELGTGPAWWHVLALARGVAEPSARQLRTV